MIIWIRRYYDIPGTIGGGIIMNASAGGKGFFFEFN